MTNENILKNKTNKKKVFLIFLILIFVIGTFSMLIGKMGNLPNTRGSTGKSSMGSHHGGSGAQNKIISQSALKASDPAPDFSLENINGETVKLSDYSGKNVILFFNEGAMCYPACWNQIEKLANDERFKTDDVAVFSVVVDPKSKWEKIIRDVPQLSKANILFDTTRAVSSSYGVLSLASSMHKGSFPGHTYFVIDKGGVIRFTFDDPNMALRNEMLISELAKIRGE